MRRGVMRILISDVPNEKLRRYIGTSASIESWFVEQEDLPMVKEVTLVRESEGALLLSFKGDFHWIPKSVMSFTSRREKPLFAQEEMTAPHPRRKDQCR